MRIAIISDSHDNLANIKKVIDWLNKEKISLILHCGDISSQETLNKIVKTFNGKAKFVRGNADFDLQNLPEIEEIEADSSPAPEPCRRASTLQGRQARYGARKIAITHYFETAKKLAEKKNPSRTSGQEYDLVFYGHTHKPWKEKLGNCRLANPGELSGQFHKPTFAVYDTDTDNLELKILEKLE